MAQDQKKTEMKALCMYHTIWTKHRSRDYPGKQLKIYRG